MLTEKKRARPSGVIGVEIGERRNEILRIVVNGYVESGEPVGCIGYFPKGESNIEIGEQDAELGYWIAKPYWNRGICTEALRLLIAYCREEKGFRTLWSDFFVDNPASGRVMEKCGFHDTGRINWCSHLYLGGDRPVKIMVLEESQNQTAKTK